MARLTLASLCGVFVAACGSESVVPVLDAAAGVAAEAAAPDVACDGVSDVPPGVPASYPKFIPMVLQVASLGGPVLSAPRGVPVFVADPAIGVDPDVARVELFLSAYARSQTWRTQLESGVWGVPDENTLFIVMLDGSRQIHQGTNRTCEGRGGYHSDLRGQSFRRVAHDRFDAGGRARGLSRAENFYRGDRR
jgi:hypothetical protein